MDERALAPADDDEADVGVDDGHEEEGEHDGEEDDEAEVELGKEANLAAVLGQERLTWDPNPIFTSPSSHSADQWDRKPGTTEK